MIFTAFHLFMSDRLVVCNVEKFNLCSTNAPILTNATHAPQMSHNQTGGQEFWIFNAGPDETGQPGTCPSPEQSATCPKSLLWLVSNFF